MSSMIYSAEHGKEHFTPERLRFIELCANVLTNYYEIIKKEQHKLQEMPYGQDIFGDFENLFNEVTGIALSRRFRNKIDNFNGHILHRLNEMKEKK